MGANKTSGNFTGIDIRGGSQISTSGSGTISLNGTGGDTEMNNHGVSVSGSQITGGSNQVMVNGIGVHHWVVRIWEFF